MSRFTLTLRPEVEDRIDLSGVTPDRLQALTQAELGTIRVPAGASRRPLKELFRMEGSPKNADEFVLRGLRGQVDYIGGGMTGGRLIVHGTAGDFLAHDMRGGQLSARGDAGRWAGRGMRNGLLEIHGDTDDHLASAFPGDTHGLREGIIHVRGDAGARIGERMRRGVIVIDGNTGNYCGSKMLAGTIIVQGKTGDCTGTGMKRGTILLQYEPNHLSPTFNECGEYQPAFLALLYRALAGTSRRLKNLLDWPVTVRRFAGDLAVNGKGEILILQD